MNNFSIKINDKEYWISRSLATVGFVFDIAPNSIHVLVVKRGPNVDNSGKWCCPCGYLDYNETLKQCCLREIKEETGILLDENELTFLGIQDSPNENRQNVTVRYVYINNSCHWKLRPCSLGVDPGEIEYIEFIDIEGIDNLEWAFDHDKIIKEILETETFKAQVAKIRALQ